MKKILTLFAMLLVTASTLLAQTPKLSYQMVVRNNEAQKVGKFNQKDLVYSTELTGNINILVATNGNYASAASGNFTATTNMNGMLSLTIVGSDDQTQGNGIVKLDKKLRDINWNQAKIVVGISTYGINDTMPVYPVPYALSALNHDSTLSTKAICLYITESTVEDVDTIYKTIMANNELHEAIDSAIVFYIKNNRTAVKNLIFHFLGQLNTDDLNEAYAEYKKNKQLDSALVDTIKNYIINHPQIAKDIFLTYVSQANANDVKSVFNAIDENPNADQIADTMVTIIAKYLTTHKDLVWRGVKKVMNTITVDEMDVAFQYLKGQYDGNLTENTIIYTTMRDTLDKLIQKFLDDSLYITCKDCDTVDLCQLLARIVSLENSEFISCPELGKLDSIPGNSNPGTTNYVYTLTDTLKNNAFHVNIPVNKDSLMFVLTYPGTQSKPDTIAASLVQDSVMKAEVDFQNFTTKGQKIDVKAVFKARCIPSPQTSNTLHFVFPLECPQVDTLYLIAEYNKAANLKKYSGIQLTGRVNCNYPEKIDSVGFIVEYKDYDGVSTKSDTLVVNKEKITNQNLFVDTLDMSYCSKTVTVTGFVKCDGEIYATGGTSDLPNVVLNFKVRGPELHILSSDPNNEYHAFADPIVLVARDSFEVGTGASVCSLSVGKHRIEEIVTACSSLIEDYNMGSLDFYWKYANANDTLLKQKDTLLVAPEKDTTYVAWMEMTWNNATCKIYDTVSIKYIPYVCKDTLVASEDTLIGPKVKISSDHVNNLCLGSHDVITLASTSFLLADTTTPKDNKLDTIYLKDVKKNVNFYDGIIDSVAYDWFDTLGHAITATGTNKDTLKMTVDRDSVIVCRLTVKFSNDTICEKNDTITVSYKFVCEDDMRDIQGNKYGTIDVNGYCWTKTNMRSTRKADNSGDIKLGAQTPTETINNGSAKYYNVSTILVPPYNADDLGLLYNHAAADSLCPVGWHLPTDEEWQKLEQYVDTLGTGSNTTITFGDSTMTTYAKYIVVPGDYSWFNTTSADDKIHFNAYPAGARQLTTLVPQGQGMYGYRLAGFWTATPQPNTTNKYYARAMDPTTVGEKILRDGVNHAIGFSVRCVNDIVPVTCPSLGATTITWDVNNNIIVSTPINDYQEALVSNTNANKYTVTIVYEGQTIYTYLATGAVANGSLTASISRSAIETGLNNYTQLPQGSYTIKALPQIVLAGECASEAAVVGTAATQEVVLDAQHHIYPTVTIGTQIWMKENLRYNPNFPTNPSTQEAPAIAYPAGNESNVTAYGLLYNYYAASTEGLCPTGWRMPTIDDFGTLLQNVENCSDVNDAKAKALADGLQWWRSQGAPDCAPGNTYAPNNASGFSARPAGWYVGQQPSTLGENARYWVMSSNNPYLYKISYSQAAVNYEQTTDTDDKKSYCVSIRCIKANN
ncbi:MAG: fibrobacter succinogenes major paralogous domain-containing protein [Bacteroidales bacterium]|nr:fibrobacter succinogenes major paralogous domain-containing protein [Bacteroidales bacterium]